MIEQTKSQEGDKAMTELTKYAENLILIQQIKDDMVKIKDKLSVSHNPYESHELDKLFEALAKAQQEMEIAKTESENPFFKSKYADLATIVKASRPFLSKNGLSVIQRILPNGNGVLYLYTRLCHSSGQWMESRMPVLPPKQDIQTLGSYLTYLRRYSYAMVTNVTASGEDDDGEIAMETPRKQGIATSTPTGCISKLQLQVLSTELEGHEDILEGVLKGFKIAKLSELPEKNYTKCIERIREIKRAKET